MPSVTPTTDGTYIVGAVAGGPTASAAQSMTWSANANLHDFVELADFGGVGAGGNRMMLAAFGGVMRTAGAVGTTSGTFQNSQDFQERAVFAVKPA
jgi:hypothetical protein